VKPPHVTFRQTFWPAISILILCLALLSGCAKRPEPTANSAKDSGSVAGEVPDHPEPLGTVPADVPSYPAAKLVGTFTAPGNGADGLPGASQYEFRTGDAPSKVMDYYHRTLEHAGMKLSLHTTTADGGGMFVAEDGANRRTVNVIVERGADGTGIRVTIRKKT
jgi:hypothetical protein